MGGFTTLSLDLGSTTGWALGTDGVIVSSGEVSLGNSEQHPGQRWLKFQEFLFKHKDVDEFIYEDVMFFGQNGHKALRVYCGLLAKLQEFALVHGKRLRCLSPSTVKAQFAGSGKAKKVDMCTTAVNLGWKNGAAGTELLHNECDAIALLWVVYLKDLHKPRFAS